MLVDLIYVITLQVAAASLVGDPASSLARSQRIAPFERNRMELPAGVSRDRSGRDRIDESGRDFAKSESDRRRDPVPYLARSDSSRRRAVDPNKGENALTVWLVYFGNTAAGISAWKWSLCEIRPEVLGCTVCTAGGRAAAAFGDGKGMQSEICSHRL